MMKHALIIIAPENFRDEELFVPQKILEEAGITTTIASREAGTCRGKLGGTAKAVIGLNQINVEDFDAVIFVGGPGSSIYFDDPAAHLITQKAVAANKVLAAICAAPSILAQAGVLKNRKATVFPDSSYEEILTKNEAILTRENLESDGKIITANDAPMAEEFGEKIVGLLGK
ncbi:DJ-1/PfpI family protein [Candidatus Gracilibacteria bacterium]|nr:DJ-1/PfpI family protein [Candidatus Gracilibacteria bacterium]MCF7855982.1 DJ-1/PfpI family protein [Candidatus Gracilibacteria bacterium]MCF7896325.1 DJ-1/PfpI family protein [Candidatus Gracilibacteria bacterium]